MEKEIKKVNYSLPDDPEIYAIYIRVLNTLLINTEWDGKDDTIITVMQEYE